MDEVIELEVTQILDLVFMEKKKHLYGRFQILKS